MMLQKLLLYKGWLKGSHPPVCGGKDDRGGGEGRFGEIGWELFLGEKEGRLSLRLSQW